MKTYTMPYQLPGILKSLLLFIAIIAFESCNKTETTPIDYYSYLPVELGRYQVYDVTQIIYSASEKEPLTTTWQEKDQVDHVMSTQNGVVTYLVIRYSRSTSADYWQKSKEYTITKYPDKLLTTTDNRTIFSLVFPPDNKITWNGNLYNNLDEQEYHYEDLNKSVLVDNISFDKSLTVVERKDTSIINRYVGIKKYALGTGLILDEQTNYEYCQDDDCIGLEQIESGSYMIRKIVESGVVQ